MNNVVLYSGGVDSFLVHHWLNKENIEHSLLYFDLGGKYSVDEVELFESYYFKKNIKTLVTVSECLQMGCLERDDAFIPNRNLLTAIMANSVTGYDNIWIGGTRSDRVNDNNQDVFKTLSELLTSMYQKNIRIDSPFWQYHKPDLVKDFVNSDGWGQYESKRESQRSLIYCTFSCYYPISEKQVVNASFINSDEKYRIDHLTKECMNCPACFRKCMSLFAGDIFIPLKKEAKYIVDHYYEEAKKYIDSDKDDVFSDSYMLPRMEATVKYCDYLYNYWNNQNV